MNTTVPYVLPNGIMMRPERCNCPRHCGAVVHRAVVEVRGNCVKIARDQLGFAVWINDDEPIYLDGEDSEDDKLYELQRILMEL